MICCPCVFCLSSIDKYELKGQDMHYKKVHALLNVLVCLNRLYMMRRC